MRKILNYIKSYRIRFSFSLGIIVLLGLLLGLRHIEAFSEFWTATIGRAYQTVVGFITSLIPWSIFEFLIIAAIVYGIMWIILFIKATKKDGFKTSSVKIVNISMVVLSIIALYVGTAGMAYYRKPLNLNLRNTGVIETSEYYDISLWASEQINQCASQLEFDENGSVKMPYSKPYLYKVLREEYAKVDDSYLATFTSKPKQLFLFGWLYSELHISGVSFLPTGESNYNQNIPEIDIPFVIAHEIAHTKGVMNETEANNLAMYVCVNSTDPFVRYSGLCNAYDSIESLAATCNDNEKVIQFYKKLDNSVWDDFKYSNLYWSKHKLFKDISNWFNDLYLKIFGDQTTEAYIDNIGDDVVIIDDKPTYVINSLSPYQKIVMDSWLKENGR